MLRRLHVSKVSVGIIRLDAREAHHARDVLRLRAGEAVELFDASGAQADAVIDSCDQTMVSARVEQIRRRSTGGGITIAAAVPKGERADWMVEKLSEIGVARFVPLQAARSVVLPSGKSKFQRWRRLAIESAKQARRAGVMEIAELTTLDALLEDQTTAGLVLSVHPDAAPIHDALASASIEADLFLVIGPEGGWTDAEIGRMQQANLTAVKLTATILRVETAAVVAAGIAAAFRERLRQAAQAKP